MLNALILPGWYQSPRQNWYPWLRSELSNKGFYTEVPDLPTMNTDQPELTTQLNFLTNNFQFNEETYVIGHNLGAVLALRLVEELKVKKLVLVAGWDFNDLTPEHQLFWQQPLNHQLVKVHADSIYCVASDNDPYFTKFTNEQMSKRLGGRSIIVRKAGHFTEQDGITEIPDLLTFL